MAADHTKNKYQIIFEETLDAIFVADTETGMILDCNQAACDLTGREREELIGLHQRELHPEVERDGEFSRSFREHVSTMKGRIIESKMLRKDGEAREISIKANTFEFEGKRLIHAVFRDITDIKKMEKRLRRVQEDLVHAQSLGSIGSWRMDVRQNVLTWSDENHHIFGIPKGETLTYETFLSTLHPDDREYVDKEWKKGLQGKPYDIEHRIIVDGRVKWVREKAYLEFGGQGELIGGFGITQDVTEKKRAEEALRKSEERYRFYIDLTGQIGWSTDADGLVIKDIPSWRNYTGQTFDEVKGWGWSHALHPDDLANTVKVWKQAVAKRSEYETEYRVRRHDGVYLHFLARGIPLFREEGIISEWVGACIDITERKQGEDSLRRARDELETRVKERTAELEIANRELQKEIARQKEAEGEKKKLEAQLLQSQKLETIGTLAGGIAHDFNNILTPIINYADLCLRHVPEEGGVRRYLSHILASANRAKDIVKQILAFSRMSRQELKPVDMERIVREALHLLRSSLPSTIEIRKRISRCGAVMADSTQMHQIVMNLCANAFQAMREGGMLEITLREVDLEEEFTKDYLNLKPGHYALLIVSDTGHGMDASTMERIFEPFFTTKETGEGTGLGLSVVNGIVWSHGGEIAVRSELGKGTTFHVYLPVSGREDAGEERTEVTGELKGKERILFVDDEEDIAIVGEEMLGELGYRVTIKTASEDALEEFRNNPGGYDLVVTDYTMPMMNGLKLAAELTGIRADIPIILTSGFSDAISPGDMKEIGIRRCVTKPYNFDDLARVIQEVINEP